MAIEKIHKKFAGNKLPVVRHREEARTSRRRTLMNFYVMLCYYVVLGLSNIPSFYSIHMDVDVVVVVIVVAKYTYGKLCKRDPILNYAYYSLLN